METKSIKALALKALHRNRPENNIETDGFQVSMPMEETGKPYKVVYSKLLDDIILVVDTDEQADAMRQRGVLDVIYTTAEALSLKGMTPDEIRAIHIIKKTFPRARSERLA